MVILTPLEMALESRLEQMGFPFDNRQLLHEKAVEDYLRRQAVPAERIQQIKDPRFKNRWLRKQREGIDWSDHIVYRVNKKNSSGMRVTYSIFPSEKNEALLRSITDYDRFEEAIDSIIKNRSFFCEEILVRPAFDFGITEETIVALRRGMLESEDFTSQLENVEDDWEDDAMADMRGLGVSFYSYKVERYLGPDVQKGLFDGLESPVKDAMAYAQAVCEYLRAA